MWLVDWLHRKTLVQYLNVFFDLLFILYNFYLVSVNALMFFAVEMMHVVPISRVNHWHSDHDNKVKLFFSDLGNCDLFLIRWIIVLFCYWDMFYAHSSYLYLECEWFWYLCSLMLFLQSTSSRLSAVDLRFIFPLSISIGIWHSPINHSRSRQKCSACKILILNSKSIDDHNANIGEATSSFNHWFNFITLMEDLVKGVVVVEI